MRRGVRAGSLLAPEPRPREKNRGQKRKKSADVRKSTYLYIAIYFMHVPGTERFSAYYSAYVLNSYVYLPCAWSLALQLEWHSLLAFYTACRGTCLMSPVTRVRCHVSGVPVSLSLCSLPTPVAPTFFLYCLSYLLRGGTTSLRIHHGSGLGYFFLPSLVSSYYFSGYSFSFFSFLFLVFLFSPSCIWVAGVRIIMLCPMGYALSFVES